jgi:hypothetical protein
MKKTKKYSNFLFEDLDREIKAADKFLNQNVEDLFKNTITNNNCTNSSKMETDSLPEVSNTCNTKIDEDLLKYKKQLKSFGFPDIGLIYYSDEDKPKILSFFDFIIMKKSAENEEKLKYKKQIDALLNKINFMSNENEKLQKELNLINEENKKYFKEKKDFESKIIKSKDSLEKQIVELKTNNTKLSNKYNVLLVEKKSTEEKMSKISEALQKQINKCVNLKSNNNIEMIDNLKKNSILKMLAKVNGAEKLLETLKNGFNESLREILFEISALKNFIYEINCDLINNCRNLNTNKQEFLEIDYNLLNMPFLDVVTQIKYIFKNNIKLINKKVNNDSEFLNEYNENNEINMTFDKKDLNVTEKEEFKNKLVFDLEESNISSKKENIFKPEQSLSIHQDEEDYQNELEFLKNKWVKTLMNIKNKENND